MPVMESKLIFNNTLPVSNCAFSALASNFMQSRNFTFKNWTKSVYIYTFPVKLFLVFFLLRSPDTITALVFRCRGTMFILET